MLERASNHSHSIAAWPKDSPKITCTRQYKYTFCEALVVSSYKHLSWICVRGHPHQSRVSVCKQSWCSDSGSLSRALKPQRIQQVYDSACVPPILDSMSLIRILVAIFISKAEKRRHRSASWTWSSSLSEPRPWNFAQAFEEVGNHVSWLVRSLRRISLSVCCYWGLVYRRTVILFILDFGRQSLVNCYMKNQEKGVSYGGRLFDMQKIFEYTNSTRLLSTRVKEEDNPTIQSPSESRSEFGSRQQTSLTKSVHGLS